MLRQVEDLGIPQEVAQARVGAQVLSQTTGRMQTVPRSSYWAFVALTCVFLIGVTRRLPIPSGAVQVAEDHLGSPRCCYRAGGLEERTEAALRFAPIPCFTPFGLNTTLYFALTHFRHCHPLAGRDVLR